MKYKALLMAMMMAATFFWIPAAGDQVSAQTWHKRHGKHKKYAYGYKNYGQYRRTQVGNRRYRLAKRYYTNDRGIRLFRWVRIYF